MGKNVTITATGKELGTAKRELLSNNIEGYENTIPSMLSDRLRNPKFSGPANPQTGIAAEWEPNGNTMGTIYCRLIPGMYLSGKEAQLVHSFGEHWVGIMQAGIHVREGEEFEIEMWARVVDAPVQVSFSLKYLGVAATESLMAEVTFDQAHWERRTCRIKATATSDAAAFHISIGGDSRLVIDQVHLRPVAEPNVSQALFDSFDHFPCPTLRFPGGCVSCTYRWKNGVGPVHLRPVEDDPVFKYKVYYDFGTDEYLELCAARKMPPFITLNTTTATPEECAEWAAYIRNWYLGRKLPVPVAYFMFGNENYGTHEIGHMTGEMYVRQLKSMVPLVRAAYPEARVMAIGERDSNGIRHDRSTPWRAEVLANATGLFDVLVHTSYSWAVDTPPLPSALESIADRVAEKAEDLRERVQVVRDSKVGCTLGIVEWNLWTSASHNDHKGFYEPNDIRHCLYAAGYLNTFCRTGDILEVANYYSLINTMGMVHLHDGQVQFSDVVKIMNLYADALPGTTLDLTVDTPMLTEKAGMVDANFIRKQDAVYGFLSNFSATEECTVSLRGLGTIQEARCLRADALLQPVEVRDLPASGESITLPPASVVRVICRK